MSRLPFGIVASAGGPLTVTATGATLTSDADYYYLTYTTSTSTAGTETGTLSVQNGQVPIDYLLVAGGGGTARRELLSTVYISWNCYYHSLCTYCDWDGFCYNYYCNYYCDNGGNASIYKQSGGGGAGGVRTGNMSLNSGAYSISIGNGGASSDLSAWGTATRGVNSTAFGLVSNGGGAGDDRQVNGVALNTGGSGGFAAGTFDEAGNITVTSSQGNAGAYSGGNPYSDVATYSLNLSGTHSKSCQYFLTNGFSSNADTLTHGCHQGFGTGGSAVTVGIGGIGRQGYATVIAGTTNVRDLPSTQAGGLTSLGLTVGYMGDSVEWKRTAAQTPTTWANTGAGAGYYSGNAGSGVLRVRIAKSTNADVKVV